MSHKNTRISPKTQVQARSELEIDGRAATRLRILPTAGRTCCTIRRWSRATCPPASCTRNLCYHKLTESWGNVPRGSSPQVTTNAIRAWRGEDNARRLGVGQWPCALDGYVSRIHAANSPLIGHRHDPRPSCARASARTGVGASSRRRAGFPATRARMHACIHPAARSRYPGVTHPPALAPHSESRACSEFAQTSRFTPSGGVGVAIDTRANSLIPRSIVTRERQSPRCIKRGRFGDLPRQVKVKRTELHQPVHLVRGAR